MNLLEKLQADLKEALKAGEGERTGTLRMVLSSVHNREIEEHAKGSDTLSESAVLDVLRKEAKKRKEAFDIYAKAGRKDLEDKEGRELKIIQVYLPKEMGEDEIEKIVRKILDSGTKDFGAIMKEAMKEISGRAEAGRVSGVVKRLTQQ